MDDKPSSPNKMAKVETNPCRLFRQIFFDESVNYALFVRSMDPVEGRIERAVKVLREMNLPDVLLVELDEGLVKCRKALTETFFDDKTGEFKEDHGVTMVVFTDPITSMEELPDPFCEAESMYRHVILLHPKDERELKAELCQDLDPECQVFDMWFPYHRGGEPTEKNYRDFFMKCFVNDCDRDRDDDDDDDAPFFLEESDGEGHSDSQSNNNVMVW